MVLLKNDKDIKINSNNSKRVALNNAAEANKPKGYLKSLGARASAYVVLLVVSMFIIYRLYYASYLGLILQWALAIATLVISGIIITKVDGLNGGYGIYLLKTKKGLSTIKKIAYSNEKFWDSFAAWGMILGFGVLSYLILGNKVSKKMYAFGLISLIIITMFILPYMSYAATFINLPKLSSHVDFITSIKVPGFFTLLYDLAHESPILLILNIITISTGFAGYVLSSILYNAGDIVLLVIKSIEISSVKPLSSGIPGVAPVIPGIDLPLVAGLIALALLLVVHEFSHGILAALSKVRLKSIGLLMLGILPMGAFVEPNEDEILKLDALSQNKISVAGVSANFLFMIIFFIPMILMLPYVVNHIYHTNVVIVGTMKGFPAYGVVKNNSDLLYWNGLKVKNLTQLENDASKTYSGEIVDLSTSTGNYSLVAKPYNKTTSLIGIEVGQVTEPVTNTISKSIIFFFYTLFALSFMLNFLIGAVNLLPIPGFDGWRIYSTSIKDKRKIHLIIAIIIIALLINVLPWF